MTDDLSGLPDELRKAAKTTQDIFTLYSNSLFDAMPNENNKSNKIIFKDFKNRKWLPAGLAAEERKQLKKKLEYSARWICFGCNSSWENHGDDAKCGNCGKERKLWVKMEKVEDVFE